jgi:hypothetical protein
MNRKLYVFAGLTVLLLLLSASSASAQSPTPQPKRVPDTALGTGFTYQGQLKKSDSPVTSTCNFQFGLWDALSSGTQLGSTQTVSGVSVANGLFTTTLNGGNQFGANAFNGEARWLAISVQCTGDGSFNALTPRQPLSPAPFAFALPGLYTQQNATSPNVIGGHSGNTVTSGVVGATIGGGGWSSFPNSVTGSWGTVGGGYYNRSSSEATVGGGGLNTASGIGATISGGEHNVADGPNGTVGGGRYNTASGVASVVGGGITNTITSAGQYATVSGGRQNTASYPYATVSGGGSNNASSQYATVGGGRSNTASGTGAFVGGGGWDGTDASGNQALATASTIAGGFGNSISVSSTYAFIGGGRSNSVNYFSYAMIGGGEQNIASNGYATVSGGLRNTASGDNAFVGGGGYNTAFGYFATVGGGDGNAANGRWSTVGGGDSNTAGGSYATIGGGIENQATVHSATVGGGIENQATADSATVGGGWVNTASNNAATVPGGANNEASGAYSFAAGANGHATHDGSFVWSSYERTDSWGNQTFTVRAHGGVRFYSGSGTGTYGVQLSSGGGSWTSLSDRAAKTNVLPVDNRAILAQVAALPVQTWNYKTQDVSIRHIGPMAQDFYAAFGVGEDDTHITTVDADGVALAAIQGL